MLPTDLEQITVKGQDLSQSLNKLATSGRLPVHIIQSRFESDDAYATFIIVHSGYVPQVDPMADQDREVLSNDKSDD